MPNVGDVYRISFVQKTAQNEPIINTFYYRISATGTGDEKAALNSAFITAVAPTFGNVTSNTVTGVNDLVQPVKPIGTVELLPPLQTAGALTTTPLPSQLAAVLTRKTATAGKGGRGRLFIGPIATVLVSGTDPNMVLTSALSSLASQLLATLTSGGWSFVPCLWKRKTQTSIDITGWSVNPMIKTRRSRAEGTRFHRRKKHTVGSI